MNLSIPNLLHQQNLHNPNTSQQFKPISAVVFLHPLADILIFFPILIHFLFSYSKTSSLNSVNYRYILSDGENLLLSKRLTFLLDVEDVVKGESCGRASGKRFADFTGIKTRKGTAGRGEVDMSI